MQDVQLLIESTTKQDRQKHLKLDDPCIERGGDSYQFRGILAVFLNTNIPKGLGIHLCHACHNSKCSNPTHLYWGTVKENNEDTKSVYGDWFGGKPFDSTGIKVSEETKQKISAAVKGRPSNNKLGINGISSGKVAKGYKYLRKYKQIWITNGISSTRIKDTDVVPSGWKRGRV